MSIIIKKKKESKRIVQSVREPSIISEMGDTNFGNLDESKNGLIVSYDSNANKFILTTADQLLSASSEDSDIPDDFVTTLESELDIANFQINNLDGGSF